MSFLKILSVLFGIILLAIVASVRLNSEPEMSPEPENSMIAMIEPIPRLTAMSECIVAIRFKNSTNSDCKIVGTRFC